MRVVNVTECMKEGGRRRESKLSTYDLAFTGRYILPTCSNGGCTAFGSDALGLKEDGYEAVWRKREAPLELVCL